jgi:O-antigen/teichoic acid export membrane protein
MSIKIWGNILLTEGAWIIAAQISGVIGVLIGTRLLTEVVTPTTFGTVNLVVGLAALFSSFFCQPLLQAVLRFYPEMQSKNCISEFRIHITESLYKGALGLVLLILVCGALASAYIAEAFLVAVLMSALVIVEVAKTNEAAWLNAARRQRVYATLGMLDAWLRPMVAVAFVFLVNDSVASILAGYIAASVLIVGWLWIFVEREGTHTTSNPGGPPMWSPMEIRRFARPLIPISLIAWISSQSDRYFIAALIGMDKAGIYAATYGLVSRPFLVLGTSVEQTLRPLYYTAVSRSEGLTAERAFRFWLFVTGSLCAVTLIVIVTFAGEIAGLFLGKEFRGGTELMPWIATGYALLATSYVFEQKSFAAKNTKAVLRIRLIGAISALLIVPFAVRFFGIFGACIGVLGYCGIQFVAAVVAATTRARDSVE